MNRLAKLAVVSFSILLLSACGGGGQTTTTQTTDPDTVFALYPSDVLAAGYAGTYNLSGSDSQGGAYTGTFSFKVSPQTVYQGEAAIPVEQTLSLRETTSGAFITSTGIEYYSADLDDFRYLGYMDDTEGTSTVAATTSVLPMTARIGDFGEVGRYTDNAGDTMVISWRLEDGGAGKAKLIVSSKSLDQFNKLQFSTETIWLIDSTGQRYSVELNIYYFDLATSLNLKGASS